MSTSSCCPAGWSAPGPTLTNRAASRTRLDDLVLAFPVPSQAAEILDFAGRWGKERTPQRRAMPVGTHLREGRKGPDRGRRRHRAAPRRRRASASPTGEIWAVHTGWSGNHTHYAERLSTGEQVIGGGELLLPGEVVLAAGRVVHLAVGLRRLRHRPGRGRPPLPPLPAVAAAAPRADRDR